MNDLMLRINDVTKQYRLGQIGGTTLRDELQRFSARIKHKEDPTKKIGAKDYTKGETFLALNGISFDVKKGERVGIIGHNGAGKSTLLKLISRITAPTQGYIGMNGRVASMLEVGTGFHEELTGRENIYMNGAILGMTKKEIDSKIEKIIDFSECRQFIDTPVKRYSSGMYVKLAFSVAAHLDSEIMIMDEVLAVGDMAFQKKCLEKMSNVSEEEGRTILYVSHNMNTIRQLCKRCIVLDHGRLIFDGSTEDAITLYLDSKENDTNKIDFSDYVRPKWLANAKINILLAEYCDKENREFSPEEPLKIRIKWKVLKPVDEVNFRLEVVRLDRTPVASYVKCDFRTCAPNETVETIVSIDIKDLAPGKYSTNYIFFERNDFGDHIEIECVEGLSFEVVRNYHHLKWDHPYWGSVILPEI